MGFIHPIQIFQISHQTFGPSHRKCPTCPMIFMNTGAVLMNTPGLRDPVVMRVLSDFYWTAAMGASLFTSNRAQRHADHCVQAARALC